MTNILLTTLLPTFMERKVMSAMNLESGKEIMNKRGEAQHPYHLLNQILGYENIQEDDKD